MSRLAAIVMCAAACKATEAPPHSGSGSAIASVPADASVAAPTTRLVAAHGRTVRLVEISANKVTTTSTIAVPSSVRTVVWTGNDPLALLVGAIPMTDDDPKYDGTVGAITASGFVALPAFPAATWAIPKPGELTHLAPHWQLVASITGEPWLGRCEWGDIYDGGHCTEWVWARIGGPIALTSRVAPATSDAKPWPTVAAPPGYTIGFAPSPGDPKRSILTCRGGGATRTFPSGDGESTVDADSLHWISSDPPVFLLDQLVDGFELHSEPIVFERCAVATQFKYPSGHAGPSGLFALAGDGALSIVRDGKQLAVLAGADQVQFAPEPATLSSTAVALASLEKQLAGDTSMFAKDAIVLAPAPVAAAGVSLVPAGVTGARIVSLATNTIGTAVWFAAELELVISGSKRTVRAVELIDGGHVRVASFAPVKPLTRVADAPAMPAPTAAGPLAELLTTPLTAGVALDLGDVAVFGTDPGEHAVGTDAAKALLGSWYRLHLVLDPKVREVDTATWGYAIATVSLAKPGGPPYRMSALVIGELVNNTWLVAAIHYLSL